MIDAHAHVWDLERRDQPWIPADSALRRTFAVPDLVRAVASTQVERVILVQAINDAGETADLLSGVREHPLIAGVVGWAELRDPALADLLLESSALVGIRHQALAEPDPAAWLRAPGVRRGLGVLEHRGLPFDLMLGPQHLRAATIAVRAHPSLVFVLDHLGKPPIASGALQPWAGDLQELAREPNVWCKLSGVQTMAHADWIYPDLEPYLDVALASFGAQRLLFGSDWPVSSRAASYGQVIEVAQAACATLSASERAAVLGANAQRVYRLPRNPSNSL